MEVGGNNWVSVLFFYATAVATNAFVDLINIIMIADIK
jgi:hypothetical protein